MKTTRTNGFTLIELLTVIAILSILFAITAVAAPRIIERARVANAQSIMNDIRTQLATYASEHGTFPPRYGYIQDPEAEEDHRRHYLLPYTQHINIHRSIDVYDPFSMTHDANQSGEIDLLEYAPWGGQARPGVFTFPQTVYNPVNPTGDAAEDLAQQMDEPRPFVYVPVDSEQARLVQEYYHQNGDWWGRSWDPTDHRIRRLNFPPSTYDSFVLISVGPEETTSGVVSPHEFGNTNLIDLFEGDLGMVYHVAALRTYYLATRDLEGNGEPDFGFINRTRGDAGNPASYADFGGAEQQLNLLPDGTNRAGPIILQY
ncbi:MAG: type II secretion system protein [Candidatus Hydrogenedentota bacterium]